MESVNGVKKETVRKGRMVMLGISGFAFWYLLYSLLGLKKGSHLGEAVQFFMTRPRSCCCLR